VAFDKFTVFGFDRKDRIEDAYNILHYCIVRTILCTKVKPVNLTSIDFDEIGTMLPCKKMQQLLEFLSTKCVNLTELSLFIIDRMSHGNELKFVNYIKSEGAAKLRTLQLPGKPYTDEILATVFEHCKHLQELTLFSSVRLTGSCFAKCNPNLKALRLKNCPAILNKYYFTLMKQCKHLTRLQISINQPGLCSTFIPTLVQSVPKLEVLIIDFEDEATLADIEQVCMLEHLFKLGLNVSCLTDVKLSKILNESKTLIHLELEGDAKDLTNKAFTELPILAPLEVIDILTDPCFVDDAALAAFKQCAKTLRHLHLDKNDKISSKGVVDLLASCPRLELLSLNGTNCDEIVLTKVLALPEQTVIVAFDDTKIDISDFLSDKPSYEKKYLFTAEDKSFFDFTIGNLKFSTNNLSQDEDEKPVRNLIRFFFSY
jgi:hypothetical protein